MGTWIETVIDSQIVLEAAPINLEGLHPDDMGWTPLRVFGQSTSIEKAREHLDEVRALDQSGTFRYRLVYSRSETRREDVSE